MDDQYNFPELEETTEKYIDKVVRFRERLEKVDTAVLIRYKSLLKPNFLNYFCIFFSDSDKIFKFNIVSKELEGRVLKEKEK